VNVRSLSADQLRVLLALDRLGYALQAEVITEAACETGGLAMQALRALISRDLAEGGAFDDSSYGYRLTDGGRDCVRQARAA
jgi:hypothetical protein